MAIRDSLILAFAKPYIAEAAFVAAGGCPPAARESLLDGGEPLADGVLCQLGNIVEVELFHQLPPVGLNGLDADVEVGGNLLGGPALGNELQHLPLPGAQR
jgi:hypothetical protein